MGTLSANRRWVRAARFVLYRIAALAAVTFIPYIVLRGIFPALAPAVGGLHS